MDIIIKRINESMLADRDYKDTMEIVIDGNLEFSVRDGEPEDATLSRDFNDCWNIESIIKKVYQVGKDGDELNISYDDIEF